jgi:hypothetical protein
MVNRRCLGPKKDIERLAISISHEVDEGLALNLPRNSGLQWAVRTSPKVALVFHLKVKLI